MIPNNRWLSAAVILSLVATMALATGCGKQRTKLYLNKVDKLLTEARKFNAEKHVNTELQAAAQRRGLAEQQMLGNDFKQSVPTGREAVRMSKEVLANAKRIEATQQKNEADAEVRIMNVNNGNKEDPDLYQKIIEIQKKMDQRFAKERWVTVIELAKDIKQKVTQLLLRLQDEAGADLVEVEAENKRLLDEGGQTHALIYVQRVADLIKQIYDNINPPTKNYLKAKALAKQAMRDAEEGIVETKKKKCEGQIEIIQSKLIRAKQLKAEYFVPDLWNACSDDFTKIIDNFWKKEYDFVLGAATGLDKQVDVLIYQTRLASARYQRDRLDQRVAELRNKGVETYLPGRLAPLVKALEEADANFKKEAFEDVEGVCKTAQIESDEIMKAFRGLADEWIRKGRGLSDRAKSIFQEMERVFREVHLTYNKPIDQALEDNKQTVKADLAKRLADAQTRLALAEVKHTAEDYRDTIELCRSVQDEATSVIATVYNVVAHNVISEIGDEITRYDREGAPEYASAEMILTKGLLKEAVDLRDKQQYQESASKAAQARAQLDVTIQAIEVAAALAIEKARAEVKRADETKTAELRPEDYQRVQQYLIEAKTQMETTRLKDAILTAQRAETLIRQASQDSARTWASQTMKDAESALADAKQSGADIQSAELLRVAGEDATQADKAFASAEDLVGQKKFDDATKKFIEAKNLSIQATEGAHRAKFRVIDEAEAAIVQARSYGAWRNQLPTMTEAVLTLDQAKAAMAAGKFDESHQLARKATAQANKITAATKNETFQKRLEVVDGLVTEATKTGGRYFEPTLLASLVGELDKLREQYNPQTFDSSDKQIADVEARLQGILETMPNVVAEWIRRQNERVAEIEKAAIPPTFAPRVSEAKKFLNYAQLDFKHGKYRNSYANLVSARRLVDELANDQAEVEYARSAREVFDDLKQAMSDFDHFLSLDVRTLTGMMRGPNGDRQFIAIAGKATPAQFRQRIDTLIVKLQAIKAPPNMAKFHEGMTDMLSSARIAAMNYERLSVLGEFDDPAKREIIQRAYDLIQSVRNRKTELEKELLPYSVATMRG